MSEKWGGERATCVIKTAFATSDREFHNFFNFRMKDPLLPWLIRKTGRFFAGSQTRSRFYALQNATYGRSPKTTKEFSPANKQGKKGNTRGFVRALGSGECTDIGRHSDPVPSGGNLRSNKVSNLSSPLLPSRLPLVQLRPRSFFPRGVHLIGRSYLSF